MPISRKPRPEPEVEEAGRARAVQPPQSTALVKAAYAGLAPLPSAPGQLIPGFGNMDTDDITIARLKLTQGMSPECKPEGGSHPQGQWYQTTAARTLGTELIIVPINFRKTVELWDSRDSGGGILARSNDGIHWDKPHHVFEIRNRNGKLIRVDTKGSVKASGLTEFGTSDPENPNSAPMASVTYRYSVYLEDYAALGTSLLIISRTALRHARAFNDRINARRVGGTPFFAQRYALRVGTEKKGPNSWFVPTFENAGDLEDVRLVRELRDRAEVFGRLQTISAVDEEEVRREETASYQGTDRSGNSAY